MALHRYFLSDLEHFFCILRLSQRVHLRLEGDVHVVRELLLQRVFPKLEVGDFNFVEGQQYTFLKAFITTAKIHRSHFSIHI